MKLNLNSFVLALLASFLLGACDSKKKDNSSQFEQAKDTLPQGVKRIGDKLPPPCEIPYVIQATGAEYNQALVNDRRKVDDYSSQNDKAALNLGVFAADIGYLSSYEKTQESIDYLTSTKRLAENLGVTTAFDKAMLERFERNIGNRDSLCNLLNDAIKQMDQILTGDTRSKLAALMLTGSFVESLYISTGLIKSYPQNTFSKPEQVTSVLTPLMLIVVKQRSSIPEVSKILSEADQTGPIPTIIEDLKQLEESYRVLNMEEQMKNNNGKLIFTSTTLDGITKMVEKLRGDIVK